MKDGNVQHGRGEALWVELEQDGTRLLCFDTEMMRLEKRAEQREM